MPHGPAGHLLGVLTAPAAPTEFNLVVADLTVVTTIDTVTLEVEGELVVADLTVVTTIDTVTLTQDHNLVVSDLTVVTTIDTVTLSMGFFPVAISGNDRYLVDQVGNPWFGVGDTCWSLCVQPTAVQATAYLEDRAAKGVNLILANIVEHAFSSQTPEDENVNGDQPFTGTAFQTGLNDPYWDHIEFIQSEALRLGITIMWCPAYLGRSGTEEGWDTEIAAASNANMTTYGEALAARLGNFPNILWLIGHDLGSIGATLEARQAALSDALQANTSHLVTVGGVSELLGSDVWSGSGVDYVFDTAYDNDNGEGYTIVNAGWNNSPTMPVGFLEGIYENDGTELDMRNQLWMPLCAGATYAIFGNTPLWRGGSEEGGWSAADDEFNSTGSQNLATFADAVELLGDSWAAMSPDTGDTFLTSGEGTGATRSSAKFGTGAGGIVAIAYKPHGGSATLTFDLTELTPDDIQISKYDPTNGATTVLGTFPNTGPQNVSSLGNNASGENDWFLIFEAADVTDLVVADLTVTTTIDTITLTQEHTLVVADLTVLTTADTITLTQDHQLVVSDLTVASVIDTVTLTQVHQLVVADSTILTTIDTITLTQVHNLTVTDQVVLVTIDTVTLTQVHNLVVADSTVLTTIDTVTLGVEGTLDVADLTVLTTIDTVTLTQVHQLVVADLTVLTTIDTITFVGDVLINICLEVGPPEIASRAASVVLQPHDASVVIAGRAADPPTIEGRTASVEVEARAASVVIEDRDADPPVVAERTTTVGLGHGPAGEPTTMCEE